MVFRAAMLGLLGMLLACRGADRSEGALYSSDYLDDAAIESMLLASGMPIEEVTALSTSVEPYFRIVLALQAAEIFGGKGRWRSSNRPLVVTGTITLNPQDCWVVLVDGAISVSGYLLEAVPIEFLRDGQRVKLTLRDPRTHPADPECGAPLVEVLAVESYAGSMEAPRSLAPLRQQVEIVLADLEIDAVPENRGTYLKVARLTLAEADEVLAHLQGRFGLIAMPQDGERTHMHIWPIAE